MESDSDNFESADENLSSDEEEQLEDVRNQSKVKEIESNIKNITLEEKNNKNTSTEEKIDKSHDIEKETKVIKRVSFEEKSDEAVEKESIEIKQETCEMKEETNVTKLSLEKTDDTKNVSVEKLDSIVRKNEMVITENVSIKEQSESEITKVVKKVSFEEKCLVIPCDDENRLTENEDKSVIKTENESMLDKKVVESLSDEKCDKPKEIERSNNQPSSVGICDEKVSKKQAERKERPTKMKSKLGVKLGTKIDKKPTTFDEDVRSEKVNPEPCWEDETGWDAFDTTEKYSQKIGENENFWNNEEQYMEIPQKENFQGIADKLSAGDRQESNNTWSSWGNWGVSSILSTASLGVSTLTNSVSQGTTMQISP